MLLKHASLSPHIRREGTFAASLRKRRSRCTTTMVLLSPKQDQPDLSKASTYFSHQPATTHQHPSQPGLSVVPLSNTKIIHWIRHGEGWHNIGYENSEDAHLTPLGWQQTNGLRQHIAALSPALNIELVVVSPLRRTLETCAGVFGVDGAVEGQPLLMQGQQDVTHEISAHAALAAPPGLPFLAHEGCRERVGENLCDRRKDLSQVRQHFPAVDFSMVESDQDVVWDSFHDQPNDDGWYPFGEGVSAAEQRGRTFLHWLMQRPETEIAVVSHCGFIHHTLAPFEHPSSGCAGELSRDFSNCEMRTALISDTSVSGGKSKLWFPGGRDWQWHQQATV